MTDFKHPPGSEKARGKGCTCPVVDNCHGAGYAMEGEQYWITGGCPLHDPTE